MHSRATDRRSASECQGKWPDQTLDQALGLPEVLVAVSTSGLSCKRAGKTRTLMPVCDSSGESRTKTSTTVIRSIEASWGWVKGDAGRRYGKQIFKIRRISVRRGGPLNDGACDGNCGDLDLSERSPMRISHSLPTWVRNILRPYASKAWVLRWRLRLRWWKLTRDRRIRRYYKAHRVIKISLGTGDHTRPGWLNTDYEPLNKEIVFVDVTKRFPFPEQSVDFFHTEHMIEHVPLSSAQFFMNECYRTLKPGGKIRIATPDI